MATLDQRYTINGLVDTNEACWENLQKMADAASSWVTYDTHSGRFAVVINQAGSSVRSFTDDNMIGPIQVAGTDLTNLYNAIEFEYPSAEIRDQNHYVRLELPDSLRNDYEPDNTLQFSNSLVNNQIQATLISNILLRQSRVDKTVTITTDYTNIDLSAGDLIDITTEMYGWTSKVFRIMRIREKDGSDGSLQLEFQCLEYEADVYSEEDIAEFLVDGPSGIRALNSIGQPGQPTITTVTIDSLPAQQVTSTVPEGIVEAMEFWAANIDAGSEFELYGTTRPTDAATFTANANAVFTTTETRNGTWNWKTRGINVLGKGPFSADSANVDYVRTQVADAILDTTPVIDSGGNVLSANLDTRINSTVDIGNNVTGNTYIDVSDLGNSQIEISGNLTEFTNLFESNANNYNYTVPLLNFQVDRSFTNGSNDPTPFVTTNSNQAWKTNQDNIDWIADQLVITVNGQASGLGGTNTSGEEFKMRVEIYDSGNSSNVYFNQTANLNYVRDHESFTMVGNVASVNLGNTFDLKTTFVHDTTGGATAGYIRLHLLSIEGFNDPSP